MKHLLLTTIAAVVLVGCGKSHNLETLQKNNNNGVTLPLKSMDDSVVTGDIEAVKQHLAIRGDINFHDDIAISIALNTAAHWEQNEIVELLIQKGANINYNIEPFRATPLHIAAEKGNTKMVSFLVDNGADLIAKDNYRFTPLHLAASEGSVNSVELLIKKGSDVNAKSDSGSTPLHGAASQGHKEIAGLLIGAGSEVNSNNDFKETPLHNAAKKGREETAKLLIDKGANVNSIDRYLDTPLHYAAEYGQMDIVELLISKDANINAKNDDGETPIDDSTDEIADILRKLGAKTKKELRAFIKSVEDGDIERVKIELEKGIDPNNIYYSGNTALHRAIWSNTFDTDKLVELFIIKGADVNAMNDDGKTPLDSAMRRWKYASSSGKKTLDLLRKHGGKTGEELKAVGK